MKHCHLPAAALLAMLILCVSVCALAAEIRPVGPDHPDVDLNNGVFCLSVKDVDRIADGGWFTAALCLEDHYSAEQIMNMVPGDTVLVNGNLWTVHEVVLHEADEPGLVESYEIYTEEEYDGYIAFLPADDGCFICRTNDWSPVTPVGDLRITLPLPDQFEYWNDVEADPLGWDGFLNDLEEYGDSFVPYNTVCVIENGMLTLISHASYPEGPEAMPEEDIDVPEPVDTESTGTVPVWQFCHGVRDGLETAVIRGYKSDCEEGPVEYEMTPEETEDIRAVAINGMIIGKANDLAVTGGTWIYSFETPEGQYLFSIEMYQGWIVGTDGMYSYQK